MWSCVPLGRAKDAVAGRGLHLGVGGHAVDQLAALLPLGADQQAGVGADPVALHHGVGHLDLEIDAGPHIPALIAGLDDGVRIQVEYIFVSGNVLSEVGGILVGGEGTVAL